ncbi:MAG TPA: hypothetical protein VFU54_13865 [Actinomycetota bacterium]|nr:hypothetical protein [Actinomycetota bacterium]
MLSTDPAHPQLLLPPGPRFGPRLRALVHHSERSRFVLALVASVLVIGVFTALLAVSRGLEGVLSLAAVLLVTMTTVWLFVQVLKAHLLGHAARVSADNLPEVEEVLDQVRQALHYHAPIQVYVIDKEEQRAQLVKFLSTRVILLDGSFVADRLSDEQRAELTFLIARYIGALKAKHLRFEPVVMVVAALEKLIFLNPFLYPYERATTYSGDQIGLACCGSLPAALNVLGGLMVGPELAPRLGLRGLLWQAVSVRRRWLPRLRQLVLRQPHLTNRYLNLLEFGSRLDPAGFAAFVHGLDDATRRDLEVVLGGMPPAGPVDGRSGRDRRARVPAAASVSAMVLLVAAAAFLRFGPLTGAAPAPATSTPATSPAVTGPPASAEPPPADPVELARTAAAEASSTAPDSVDAAGRAVAYPAGNVSDGRRATTWRTRGDGRGETLTLTWDHVVRVAAVGLVPGYDKRDPHDGTDRFWQNRRIASARVVVDDGSSWTIELADSRELQQFRLDPAPETTSVTIEILDTVAGDPETDYTAVSEVSVLGTD